MSTRVSYKKQFVFGILLILIIFLIVEAISQILWYNIKHECGAEKTYFKNFPRDLPRQLCNDYENLKYDEKIIRKNSPNQHLSTLNINSLGFRGHEISNDKEINEYRIIMVGGSTTFGVGSPNDTVTIPSLLEKKLQEKFGSKIKVINAGVIAAGSSEETYYIKNDLIKLKPDLIIVFDGYNDAFNVKLSDYDNTTKYEVLEKRSSIEKIAKQYFSQLALPNVIYQNIHDEMQISYLTEDIKKENTNKWISRWNEVCDLSKSDGFDLLVTVQPMIGTSDRTLTPIEDDIFKRHKTQKNIEFLNALGDSISDIKCEHADLRHTFDGVEQQVFFSPVHTGDFGNKIITDKIYEKSLPIIMHKLS